MEESICYFSTTSPLFFISSEIYANFLLLKGNYSEALNIQLKSTAYYDSLSAKDSNYLIDYSTSLSLLSSIYSFMGDYTLAEKIKKNSLTIQEKVLPINHNELIGSTFSYALILQKLGKLEDAKRILIKLVSSLNFSQNDRIKTLYLLESLHSLGFIYVEFKDLEGLDYVLLTAGDIHEKIVDYPYNTQIFYELSAERFRLVNQFDSAYYYYQLAHAIRQEVFKKIESQIGIVESYQSIADILLLQQKFTEAIKNYNIALQLPSTSFKLPQSSQYLALVPILDGKAQAHLARYERNNFVEDLDTALWCYQIADSLVDKARDRLQNEESKLFYTKKARLIYEHAIHLCLLLEQLHGDEKYLKQAFYFSERNKAVMLFQSLQDAGAKLQAGVPDSLLTREQNLKIDIAFYQRKVFEAEHSSILTEVNRLEEWRQILFDTEESYRKLQIELEETYPEYFSLKYNHRIISSRKIQEKLAKDELLIEYFWGDSVIYVFAIGKTQIKIHAIQQKSDVSFELNTLIQELNNPQQDKRGLLAFQKPARTLFSTLLEPILDQIEGKNLILIPDGKLSLIPFEILLTGNSRLTNINNRKANRIYKELPYFFKSFSIRYGYSSTILFQNPIPKKNAAQDLLAFAPAYEGKWFLKFNQPQAESIAKLMGGELLLGEKATKANFKKAIPNFNILHLAMHAEPSFASPLNSFFRFAGSDSTDESKLFAYELYNTPLSAKMAVLAACETASGKLETGEGVYSLARAFRYSGCPSVISSLWKADGKATTLLMTDFYEELKKGKEKSVALQNARFTYLENASNDKLHPYYWANFVLIGENAPIENTRYWVWMVIGSLLILGAILGLRVRKTF